MEGLVDIQFAIIAPILVVLVAALVVLLLELILPAGEGHRYAYPAALLGVLVSLWYVTRLWVDVGVGGALPGFGGAFVADRFGLAMSGIVLGCALLSILLSAFRTEDETSGFLALCLWVTAGMMVLGGASNLMVIFLGLELLSLGLYVLVGFRRDLLASQEAAFKYLVLGSVSSGFLLFGLALLYGAAGDISLAAVGAAWEAVAAGGVTPTGLDGGIFSLGLALTLVGFAFKLGLVPFHVWMPDVYEGAPTPVTALMSVGTKVAAFALLARFLLQTAPAGSAGGWTLAPLWVLAILSMIVGNTGAVPQQNLKRLLGYSGVAHAGYLLVALPGLRPEGVGSALFYLMGYLFCNIGAFAVIAWLTGHGEDGAQLATYRGLFRRRPWPAVLMILFMFALAGIPPTAGFAGKLLLLGAGLAGGGWLLAACLILTTVISLYVYLKVIVAMVAPEGVELGRAAALAASPAVAWEEVAAADDASGRVGGVAAADRAAERSELPGTGPLAPMAKAALAVALAVCAAGTLYLGLWPQAAVKIARLAAGVQ